ncbi:MAG TPA: TDP-N-acetylfucosamine:lipid II N-acetylfucosaminyltransferase [Chryseosolibacter sp.]|nr:TDP-N-acetylfucosamine:lipid II N-acetylfucosaminyltransferase [Chryseosolibacter sp.]
MNLHIVPDSKFTSAFYKNLAEANLLGKNKLVVRTNKNKLSFVSEDLPFAPLYSPKFDRLVGQAQVYDKVFLHQLTPLMYRWVASRAFRELNWMVWGTDLYNLPFLDYDFHEVETRRYVRKNKFDYRDVLYRLKVYLTNMIFMRKAYSKVDFVLTWMSSEYEFAKSMLPLTKAGHKFFFYENQAPYHTLDQYLGDAARKSKISLVIGNSGTPTNNHLDAIHTIQESGLHADLLIPVSYGEKKYIDFLKKNTSFYTNGTIEFIDAFMQFPDYIKFLKSADALVMNHVRPQGYGNIFMMMYLGKPVILNERNLSLPDLKANGFHWQTLRELGESRIIRQQNNRESVKRYLSHDKLLAAYEELFGPRLG